ncbi:LysR family transcriptional regulator [Ramlibacter sp. G-1-2-2]|uniref:LysR family transcriptional regulator n=1 Tax=Ramlibacter agri TaxID=2728837 RepID=A0A848H9X7_9BURK|nr:LysR substrate-binding domain-containing protein [Ramlibacter agri]NML47585.1 LysR family transcriptional regulator [Ramlibacter agri]
MQTPRSRTADLDLLRVFDALVRLGSFTAAAKALSRTQSAVSMQIKRLEEQLGAQLVTRGTRRLAATPAGLQLLPVAREMLALNEQLFSETDPQEVAGTISIGTAEYYGVHVLPALVAEFCRSHPRIHVAIHTGIGWVMRAELGTRFDIVIGHGAVGAAEGTRLHETRVLWATGPDPELHKQRPLPLAVNPEGAVLRRWATAALDQAGIPWRIAYTSTSAAGLESAVRAGLAIGAFTEATLSNRLRALGPEDGMPALPDAELWLAVAPARPAVELMEAFLIHKLRGA